MRRPRSLILAAAATLVAGGLAVIIPMAAEAAACTAPAWNASTVYTKGNKVSYSNNEFTAQWWTQGETPNPSAQWAVWKLDGACDGGTNPPPPPPPGPNPPPPPGPNPPPPPGPNPPPSGSCGPTWAEGTTYQAGTKVSYNGRGYEALVTHTAHPGANWNPASTPTLWRDLGACSGTNPPPPPPPGPNPPPPPPPGPNPPPPPPPANGLPKHALVGYLHASFANGSGYMRMADVSNDWDIINLAFGEPTSPTSGDIRFTLCPASECPNVESESEFIAAIQAKRRAGKKVLLSIGGANGQVRLETTAARDKFVSSISAIIDKYGLDGIDIDFEGHSLSLNAGDRDFRNPTTPVIVNLIAAVKSLKAKYGNDFVLTMAPETFFVQVGYQFYGSGQWGGADPRAGAYLPVIYALRNDLTMIHVQDYNSGAIMGMDGQYYTMGNVNFHVAMTDMLLNGFPIEGNTGNMFPALREDQVGFGVPAGDQAGNGYTSTADVQAAVNCLVKGTSCGSYRPRSGTNPNFRGLMTWSINWDKFYNYQFSRGHESFLNGLG